MEALGQGLLLERRGSAAHGPHPSLIFEGRFDATQFAARAMLDAARRVPRLAVGKERDAVIARRPCDMPIRFAIVHD